MVHGFPAAQVEILKRFFEVTAYPTEVELANLKKECSKVEMKPLSTKQIKEWFVRARFAEKKEEKEKIAKGE
ncbi:unnamed protein product, partial [Caenorhabditis brenneri]